MKSHTFSYLFPTKVAILAAHTSLSHLSPGAKGGEGCCGD
jgi:hypothetical protein